MGLKADDTNKHVSDHANTIEGFTDRFWVGIDDITEEGSFKYNSDQSIILWENWRGGQPNNINNQDCVAVNSNGEWDDDACLALKSFVCEKGTYILSYLVKSSNSVPPKCRADLHLPSKCLAWVKKCRQDWLDQNFDLYPC